MEKKLITEKEVEENISENKKTYEKPKMVELEPLEESTAYVYYYYAF